MVLRILQVLVCAVSLVSLQGCFYSHSKETVVRDRPASQTTTVSHSGGDSVDVTTTR